MTKGRFIILIGTICIIIGIGVYYFYQKNNPTPNSTIQKIIDFSIFDTKKTSTDQNNPSNENSNPSDKPNQRQQTSKLQQVSYKPIAGYGVFSKNIDRLVFDEKTNKNKTVTDPMPVVRYVDQETGIIYEQDDKNTELRISNTTIPNTYEALFSSDMNHIIYRFLDSDNQTIETYIGTLINNTANTPKDLNGYFINQNIKNISLSPDGLSYNFLKPKQVGVDVVSNNFTNPKEKVLFSSPLAEWLIDSGTNYINLTTKPSGLVKGFSYNIDLKSGFYTKTVSGLGLTQTSSPDGLYNIYSTIENKVPKIYIIYNKQNITNDIGLKTFSEKCVYTKDAYYCAVPNNIYAGTYPDDWYQGTVSFNDDLWYIDLTNKKLTYIGSLNYLDQSIDATDLKLSSDNNSLYFIDKKTSILWKYILK